MKLKRFSRRRFLLTMCLAGPAAVFADARWCEPGWLKVRRLQLAPGSHKHRFIHFTDLHYKGDRRYAESVVKTINAHSPEFVCFTGDLIEEVGYLRECLEILSGIKSPMYGVPGNHDYWSHAPFDEIAKSFDATGGAFLLDDARTVAAGKIHLIGAACRKWEQVLPPLKSDALNILMIHYPAWVKALGNQKFDLMLAGHSHGGQVRIPFYGPVFLPFAVDEFDLGWFRTNWGPLYVNPGIGWFPVPYRFNCRPEITVVEV